MKTWFFLAIAIFFSFKLSAQANFKFEKTSHHFGKVKAGKDTLWTDFVFTNDGTETLTIQDVKTSCDCTLADFPKKGILPGQKAVIRGGFKIEGKSGSFRKNVIIIANTMPGTTILTLEGEITE
ncbi:MAG: DUF1573 domain-containing protein [Cytophagaceae bacterium]|jgi:hypothetical protein|nr:DUF1573 domain-containing protein [Cytophagaceae bacterium]